MRKKLLAVFLSMALVICMIPTFAMAATITDTWAVKLNVAESSDYAYKTQNAITVGFGIQSDNLKLQKAQAVVFAIDGLLFDLLEWDGDDAVKVTTHSIGTSFSVDSEVAYDVEKVNKNNNWSAKISYAKKTGNETIYVKIEASQDVQAYSVADEKNVVKLYLGLKDGKTKTDITSGSIRFATKEEAESLAQGQVIMLTDGDTNTQRYLPTGDASSTILATPKVEWIGITPAKTPLAGSIDIAGTVKVGEKLTASTTGITSTDPGELTFAWYREGTTAAIASGNEYMLTSADAGKTITLKVSAANYSGTLEKTTTAVANAAQTAPTITDAYITVKTADSITVTNNTAWEYSKDGGSTWQSGNTLSGLAPDTEYSVCVRLAAKQGYEVSPASNVIKVKTTKAQMSESAKGTLAGYTGEYDSNVHNAIQGTPADGYTIKAYSTTSETEGFSNTVPTVKNVADTKTVWIKLSKTGYEDKVFAFDAKVTAKALTDSMINFDTVQNTYDGSEKTVKYKVKDGSTELILNTDYQLVSGDKATNVEENTFKIKGKGNYSGEATAKWTLKKATPKAEDFQISGATSADYNGNTHSLTVTAKDTVNGMGNITVKYQLSDGEKTTALPKDAGTYTVTFDVAEGTNYEAGTALSAGTLTINKVDYAGTKTANAEVRSNQVNTDVTLTLPALPNGAAYGTASVTTGSDFVTAASVSESVLKYSTTAKNDGTTGTITIPVTGATNYNGYSVVVTVTAKDKTPVTITGFNAATGLIYDGYTKTGYTGTAAYSPSWSGTLTTTYYLEDGTTKTNTANSGAVGEGQAPKNAGTYNVTLAIPDSDANYTGGKTVTFTIAPKTLTKNDLEYTGTVTKEYDGTTNCSEVTAVSVKSGVLASGDTLTVNGTAVYNSANVYEATKLTFTPTAIESGNYRLAATETLDIAASITAKTVTPVLTVSGSYTFDGTEKQATVTVTAGETTLAKDVDYTVAYENNTDAGSAAKVKVTAKSGRNYTWLDPAEKTFTIAQDAAKSLTDIKKEVKYSNTALQEVNLSGLMPTNAGTLSYELGTITDSNSILATKVIDNANGTLKFGLNNSLSEYGQEATIQVKIKSTNYAASTVNVKVKTINKNVPTLTVNPITFVYTGSPIADTAISGTARFDGNTVEGTWKFKDGVAVTNVSDSGSKTVVFTPTDSAEYAAGEATVSVTITKAISTVTPKFDKITESGKKLSDANLQIETSTPAGSIAWDDPDTTEVEANKEYGWKFTPTDAGNYDTVTGKITVWTKSSGGGAIGGGAVPLPTTEKPEITIDNTQGKAELSADGTTASITANAGYEIEKVTVNGVDKGAVNKLTGLKTGDKVVVTFKSTAPTADGGATLETIKEKVAKLQFMARSSKMSKKNVKLTLKFDNKTSAQLDELKSLGYTVKYKFYRSTKKSSGYKATLTKTSKSYTNTKGVKGTMYYYKARVQVYDKDGKLVAETALKQCKYASRQWTK